jgi:hypothetical protein
MNQVKKILAVKLLRNAALGAILIGVAASLGLTIYTGRNNHSIVLVAIFLIWVLSPFAGLLAACLFSRRWTVSTRVTLYVLVLVITCCSLLGYSGVWVPRGTKTAFIFLAIPGASWLFILVSFPVMASWSARSRRKS